MTTRDSFLVLLLLTLGCAADLAEPAPYTIESVCEQTRCGREVDECRAEASRNCSECFSYCASSGYCDCSRLCDSSYCSGYCTGGNSPCIEWGYEAELSGFDEAVLNACRNASESWESCGGEALDCFEYARTESRDGIAYYDCIAELECDESDAACPVPAPRTAEAASVCRGLEGCGWEPCGAAEADIAAWFGWLRQDIVDAALSCLSLDCDAREECMDAWYEPLL